VRCYSALQLGAMKLSCATPGAVVYFVIYITNYTVDNSGGLTINSAGNVAYQLGLAGGPPYLQANAYSNDVAPFLTLYGNAGANYGYEVLNNVTVLAWASAPGYADSDTVNFSLPVIH